MFVIDDIYAVLHAISQALDVPLFGPVTLQTVVLILLMFLFIKEAVHYAMRRVVDSEKGAEALSVFISILLCFEYIALISSLPEIVINAVAYLSTIAILSSLLFSFLDEISMFKEAVSWGIAIALSLMFAIATDIVKLILFIMNSVVFLWALISFAILFFLKKENWGFVVSAFIMASFLIPANYFLPTLVVLSLLFLGLVVIPLSNKMYIEIHKNKARKEGLGGIKEKVKGGARAGKYFIISLASSLLFLGSFAYIQTGDWFKAAVYGGGASLAILLIALIWEFLLLHSTPAGRVEMIDKQIEEFKKVIEELKERRDKEENINIKMHYDKWIDSINTKIKDLEDKKIKIIRGEE